MSWDIRDTTPAATAPDTARPPEPPSPAMVPTLALLYDLDDALSDPLTLDTLPAHEQAQWREQGLTPPSQWAALRRLMTRGVMETT